jgi:hypothetical protein
MPTRDSLKGTQPDKPGLLSKADLEAWVKREMPAVEDEYHRRIREAALLVAQFVDGEISQEEANEKYWRYQQRWGEASPSPESGSPEEPSLDAIRVIYKQLFNRELGE